MNDEEVLEAWMERGRFRLDEWQAANPHAPLSAGERDAFEYAWELTFEDQEMMK